MQLSLSLGVVLGTVRPLPAGAGVFKELMLTGKKSTI